MNKTSLLLRNKQKGIAPILIVILIALAVGGYLLYQKQFKPVPVSQPSPSPIASPIASSSAETANWKTYTVKNSVVSYELKYPSDWKVNRSPDADMEGYVDKGLSFIPPTKDNDGYKVFGLSCTADNLKLPAAKDLYQPTSGNNPEIKVAYFKEKEINGNKSVVYVLDYQVKEGLKYLDTSILRNQKPIVCNFSMQPKFIINNYEKEINGLEIYQLIVNSFKFLP